MTNHTNHRPSWVNHTIETPLGNLVITVFEDGKVKLHPQFDPNRLEIIDMDGFHIFQLEEEGS